MNLIIMLYKQLNDMKRILGVPDRNNILLRSCSHADYAASAVPDSPLNSIDCRGRCER